MKKVVSDRQRRANRQNARQSTGPTSPASFDIRQSTIDNLAPLRPFVPSCLSALMPSSFGASLPPCLVHSPFAIRHSHRAVR